jgi:hypothetical protein
MPQRGDWLYSLHVPSKEALERQATNQPGANAQQVLSIKAFIMHVHCDKYNIKHSKFKYTFAPLEIFHHQTAHTASVSREPSNITFLNKLL